MLKFIKPLAADFARKGFDNYPEMLKTAYSVGDFSFLKTHDKLYSGPGGKPEQIKFRFVAFSDKHEALSHIVCINAAIEQHTGFGQSRTKKEIIEKNFWTKDYPNLTKSQMLSEIQAERLSLEPGVLKAAKILQTKNHRIAQNDSARSVGSKNLK